LTANTVKCNLTSHALNTPRVYSNVVIRNRKWLSAEPEVDRGRQTQQFAEIKRASSREQQ